MSSTLTFTTTAPSSLAPKLVAVKTHEDDHIDCPYLPGAVVQLNVSQASAPSTNLLKFRIIHAFTPFTLSAVVVAEPISPDSTSLSLPSRVVLKLFDPRHFPNRSWDLKEIGHPRYTSPWTHTFRAFFLDGLRRFRDRQLPNHWPIAVSATQPLVSQQSPDPYDETEDLRVWAIEMDFWSATTFAYKAEVAAYDALESLQGQNIPKLLGTATYVPDFDGMDDPVLNTVPCLILESIDGAPLHEFELVDSYSTSKTTSSGRLEISKADAELASVAIIDAVRAIRDLGVTHHDLADRNILLRSSDRTKPVLIDFGHCDVSRGEVYNPEQVRDMLRQMHWHLPSPWIAWYNSPHPLRGYRALNLHAEQQNQLYPGVHFERIPDAEREPDGAAAVDEDGNTVVWEAPRWRYKAGLRTRDADLDWQDTGKWAMRTAE
ncbi:hypothetical protein HMN09_00095700 [Mycena chlorophos]|uniref:Protein kinase domain-containing protein n=1 Tax=Mycena chlorophos TaxID=658473 RepID=A0A8H6WSL2_MYCCL|nr:hypothetical protein HMN09_00095700 [Mycena chlorophos]